MGEKLTLPLLESRGCNIKTMKAMVTGVVYSFYVSIQFIISIMNIEEIHQNVFKCLLLKIELH